MLLWYYLGVVILALALGVLVGFFAASLDGTAGRTVTAVSLLRATAMIILVPLFYLITRIQALTDGATPIYVTFIVAIIGFAAARKIQL